MILALFLSGCPQGAGASSIFGQDDSGDSDEAVATDASSETPTDGGDAGSDADGGEGTSRSSGALCGANGLDLCAPMHCDVALGCVECEKDVDCPLAASFCLAGRCVGCRPGRGALDGGTSDCSPPTACSVDDYGCHAACTSDDTCAAGLSCDLSTGECVGCSGSTDCQTGVCSPALRRCVECIDDTTCPQKLPRCRLGVGTCAACLSNDDCGLVAPVCDPVTFACKAGCTNDAQCPGQRCDLVAAGCVAVEAPEASADGGS